MEINEYQDGVPCWIDCSCSDVDKAADFYSSVFGWEIPEGNADFGGYRSAQMRGKNVAGLMGQMEPGPVVWSTYLKTSDADATAAAVQANGGSLMFPVMDVGDLGRMAILIDPVGAVFGVWQPGVHTGAVVVNEPGTFCWSELITTDVEASKAFYSAVFGFGIGGSDDYVEFQVDGRSIAGMMAKNDMMPADMPSNWGVYFAVSDCDASVAQAVELGGATFAPPMDLPVGRMAVLSDPNGAPFSIIALSGAM